MTDLIKSDWKELDSDNTNPSPNGVQGGYAPSTIGPIIRSIRGALKRFYVQSNAVYATTGTGAAYVLTYAAAPQGYSAGIIYRFISHADNTGAATLNINSLGAKAILSQHGEPLTAGKIKAGKVVEVVYHGASFELISNEVHDSKFTGTTNLANIAVSGNTNVTGTTSLANLSVSGELTVASTISSARLELGSGTTNTPFIDFHSSANPTDYDSRIIASGGTGVAGGGTLDFTCATLTKSGQPIWHAGNDGSASGLDADLLDGQHGAYYLDLANSTGTLADNRLPSTMTGKYFTGPIGIDSAWGTNEITRGTGDGASYSSYNIALKGWYGIGLVDRTTGTVNGFYNFRNGVLDTKGGFYKNGTSVVYSDGGTYPINITGRAFPKRSDGSDISFIWNGQAGQPNWLWGGADGINMYVYNPSNFSVAYAANAGALNGLTTPEQIVSSGTASRPFNGIGTYVYAKRTTNVAMNPNDTCAGSVLQAGGTNSGGNATYSSTLAGTWRCMGYLDGSGAYYTLFLRIS